MKGRLWAKKKSLLVLRRVTRLLSSPLLLVLVILVCMYVNSWTIVNRSTIYYTNRLQIVFLAPSAWRQWVDWYFMLFSTLSLFGPRIHAIEKGFNGKWKSHHIQKNVHFYYRNIFQESDSTCRFIAITLGCLGLFFKPASIHRSLWTSNLHQGNIIIIMDGMMKEEEDLFSTRWWFNGRASLCNV